MKSKKIMSYSELLEQYPNWILLDAAEFAQEETAELTLLAKQRKLIYVGHYLKFLQSHDLTKRIICKAAPDIPENLKIYLRDITPLGLCHFRIAYPKWLKDKNLTIDAIDNIGILEKELLKLQSGSAECS